MRRISQLGKVTSWLFIAIILSDFLASVADISALRLVNSLRRGIQVSEHDLISADDFLGMTATVQLIAVILASIAFLFWFGRAYSNLHKSGLEGIKFSSGWAVGSFFVPFLNLYRPYDVMRDLWRGSFHLARGASSNEWSEVRPYPLLSWWWLAYLTTSILSRVASIRYGSAFTLDQLDSALNFYLFVDLFDAAAAFLAYKVIREVTNLQSEFITSLNDGA